MACQILPCGWTGEYCPDCPKLECEDAPIPWVSKARITTDATGLLDSASRASTMVADSIGVPDPEPLFVVRLYDGFDHEWMDITKPVPHAEAQRVWDVETKNGTERTHFNNIDYYAIFPAETTMMFSEQGVYGDHPEYRRD